jgi:sulfur-oxidizing protein SoxY
MLEYRRKLLAGGSVAAIISPLLGLGLLVPTRTIAAEWQKASFSARNVNDALKAYGSANAIETGDIVITAPEIAENGAKVEIEITSRIANTRSLAVFADKNPTPLCAEIEFGKNAQAYTRIQVKLGESTRIRAIAKAQDGKTHVAFKEIKVTLGGCGG